MYQRKKILVSFPSETIISTLKFLCSIFENVYFFLINEGTFCGTKTIWECHSSRALPEFFKASLHSKDLNEKNRKSPKNW